MKEPFTMEEYIRAKGLGVSHRDPQATRIIAAHLRKKGYVCRTVQIGGSRRRRWERGEEEIVNYDALKAKLEGME